MYDVPITVLPNYYSWSFVLNILNFKQVIIIVLIYK